MTLDEYKFEYEQLQFSGLSNNAKSKPILLFLHGYLDNAASFIPLAPYLNDFNVIALDLAGHGNSFHRAKLHPYHLTDYVYDLALFVKAITHDRDEKKLFVVGHSLGGIVGSIFSATYPELIKAFVSIEACGPLSQSEETTVEQLKSSFESRSKVQQSAGKDTRTFNQIVRSRLAVGDLEKHHAETIMSRNCEESAEGLKWHSDRALRTVSAMRMTEKQALNVLASIECPMLLILGTEGFEKVKRNLTNRVDVMDALVDVSEYDGGHYVHMQQPERVAKRICQFFMNNPLLL